MRNDTPAKSTKAAAKPAAKDDGTVETVDEPVDRIAGVGDAPRSKAAKRAPGECVVDEAFHVGRAVNGEVCSYHAMRYKADGTPR